MNYLIENCFCKNDPFTLEDYNFFTSNSFLLIFSMTNVPRGGFHLLFGHHKQWGPPLKTTSKPYLNCSNTNLFTIVYSFLFITSHLGKTYVENLNMSKKKKILSKMMIFLNFFKDILHANHRDFILHFHQFFWNYRFLNIP
jgi:hypothetical protein